MEIYVNQQKLEFSLEKEQTLAQVVQNLANWTKKEGFFIDKLFVNSQDIELEGAFSSSLDVKDIKKIELLVKGSLEQVEEILPSLKQYVERFIEEIKKGEQSFCKNKQEKLEGLAWVTETLMLIAENLKVLPQHVFVEGRTFEELINFFKVSLSALTKSIHDSEFFYSYFEEGVLPRFSQVASFLDQIVEFFYYLNTEQESKFLKKFLDEVSYIQDYLTNIPILLQEGKDQDALVMVQKVVYYFESLNIIGSKALSDESDIEKTQEVQQEVIDLMNEMYESFKNKDIVTVSDIIEYEISEKLSDLTALLEGAWTESQN